MRRSGCLLVAVALAAGVAFALWFAGAWYSSANLDEDTPFIVESGSTLTSAAQKLEEEGIIASADNFLLRAKVLGGGDPIKAGEFLLPAGSTSFSMAKRWRGSSPFRKACQASWSTKS